MLSLSQLPKDICCILQTKIIFASILQQKSYICQYLPLELYLPCREIPANATGKCWGGICRPNLLRMVLICDVVFGLLYIRRMYIYKNNNMAVTRVSHSPLID